MRDPRRGPRVPPPRTGAVETAPVKATVVEAVAAPLGTPLALPNLNALVNDATLAWEAFRPGIEIHRLYAAPDGQVAALLRYAPGARLPHHRHVGLEHILVLSGSQEDDRGTYHVGSLLVHPPGTSHAVRSRTGCVVLALWEKPVEFD